MNQEADETSDRIIDRKVHCPQCDYNLTGAPAKRCPWCGWRIESDDLVERSKNVFLSRRLATAVVGAVVGVGAVGALYLLVTGASALSLHDGVICMAVLVASFGNLFLAGLSVVAGRIWPLPHREVADVLRVVAGVAIVGGVFGASEALTVTTRPVGVEGVAFSGTLEFLLRSALFTFPGWTLLLLSITAFRSRASYALCTEQSGDTTADVADRLSFVVKFTGPFAPDQLEQTWSDTARPTTAAIEAAITRIWDAETASAKLTDRILFDGPLVRLRGVTSQSTSLLLDLGPTCYRDFVGTNLHNGVAVLQDRADGLADPIGVSGLVLSSDGFLVFGRRSDRVAYHAGYLHTIGGMLEPTDRTGDGRYDLSSAVTREVREELGLRANEVGTVRVTGMVCDRTIYQPELLFEVRVALSKSELRDRFDPALAGGEHTGIEFVRDEPEAIQSFMENAVLLTPVASASILLHGRCDWGTEWYDGACQTIYG